MHLVWLAYIVMDAVRSFNATHSSTRVICVPVFTLHVLGETGQLIQATWRSKYLLYVARPFVL